MINRRTACSSRDKTEVNSCYTVSYMHVLHVHTDIQLIPLLARYAVGVPPIAVLANKMLQITGPKILQNVFSYSALQDCSTIVFICKFLIIKVAISPVTSMVGNHIIRGIYGHAPMICHTGSIRHNEVRDITASLLTEVCHNVAIEPLVLLQPLIYGKTS